MWFLHLTHRQKRDLVFYFPADTFTACRWLCYCHISNADEQNQTIRKDALILARQARNSLFSPEMKECTQRREIQWRRLWYKTKNMPYKGWLFVEEVCDINSRLFSTYLLLQRSSQITRHRLRVLIWAKRTLQVLLPLRQRAPNDKTSIHGGKNQISPNH